MGFYLVREDKVQRSVGLKRWPAILRLARAYGWKSAGAVFDEEAGDFPRKRPVDDYEVMCHQLVRAEDAQGLADALERALVHFSRNDQEKTVNLQIKTGLWTRPNSFQEEALMWFAKDQEMVFGEDHELEDLIAFFREGAFRIA